MKNIDQDNELKIKSKFLINIDSRTEEKKRKFTEWLAVQRNPQNSFLSLVEHCIDRFGYVDVTDHDIAKKLHTEFLFFNNEQIKSGELDGVQSQNKLHEEERQNIENTEVESDEEDTLNADLNSF